MKNFLTLVIFASTALAQGNSPASKEAVVVLDARDQLPAIANYIHGRKEHLAMRDRAYDIFGLPQDPKKARRAQQGSKVAAAKPKVELPLQEIVDALPVTMIDTLGDRVVMSGAPPFSKGETLELDYKGQKVILIFEGSRSSGAYFRDAQSKKLRAHKMTRLPKGIQQGNNKQFTAGGIHKEGSDGPKKIKLDLNFPPGPGGPGPN